ncbi:hypothetical protein ACXC9Q_10820 [Kribbella sp. CWNU-51]
MELRQFRYFLAVAEDLATIRRGSGPNASAGQAHDVVRRQRSCCDHGS